MFKDPQQASDKLQEASRGSSEVSQVVRITPIYKPSSPAIWFRGPTLPDQVGGGQQRSSPWAKKPLNSSHGTDPPKVHQSGLGGGLKYFLFSHLLGEMIQIDEHIFSIGLKPPTRGDFSHPRKGSQPNPFFAERPKSGLLSRAAWP